MFGGRTLQCSRSVAMVPIGRGAEQSRAARAHCSHRESNAGLGERRGESEVRSKKELKTDSNAGLEQSRKGGTTGFECRGDLVTMGVDLTLGAPWADPGRDTISACPWVDLGRRGLSVSGLRAEPSAEWLRGGERWYCAGGGGIGATEGDGSMFGGPCCNSSSTSSSSSSGAEGGARSRVGTMVRTTAAGPAAAMLGAATGPASATSGATADVATLGAVTGPAAATCRAGPWPLAPVYGHVTGPAAATAAATDAYTGATPTRGAWR